MAVLAGSSKLHDVLVCGLNHVEVIGDGNSRYVFYTMKLSRQGVLKRRAALSLVMPTDALPDAVMKSCSAHALHLIGDNCAVLFH